jgi:preprotein translocase subunit SecG
MKKLQKTVFALNILLFSIIILLAYMSDIRFQSVFEHHLSKQANSLKQWISYVKCG